MLSQSSSNLFPKEVSLHKAERMQAAPAASICSDPVCPPLNTGMVSGSAAAVSAAGRREMTAQPRRLRAHPRSPTRSPSLHKGESKGTESSKAPEEHAPNRKHPFLETTWNGLSRRSTANGTRTLLSCFSPESCTVASLGRGEGQAATPLTRL